MRTHNDKTEGRADAGSDAAMDIAAVDGCYGRILEILASARASVARYTLGGLENKIMAADYETVLPDTKLIEAEMERVKRALELAGASGKT